MNDERREEIRQCVRDWFAATYPAECAEAEAQFSKLTKRHGGWALPSGRVHRSINYAMTQWAKDADEEATR